MLFGLHSHLPPVIRRKELSTRIGEDGWACSLQMNPISISAPSSPDTRVHWSKKMRVAFWQKKEKKEKDYRAGLKGGVKESKMSRRDETGRCIFLCRCLPNTCLFLIPLNTDTLFSSFLSVLLFWLWEKWTCAGEASHKICIVVIFSNKCVWFAFHLPSIF